MVIETADPARLRASLRASLPDAVVDAVDAIVGAAAPGCRIYAVGGAVRDLLLGRPILDLDLVVETDAIALLGSALPQARVTGHRRFGTATVVIGGTRMDVAAARSDTYARPGALPTTVRAPIEIDLRRRDFACNAVGLRLDAEAELLDPGGGLADIAAMRIRVLHDRSFIDDPTRIFRAFRYAARLDFTIDARTSSLLASGLPNIRTVGGERLRREIELILGDTPSGGALEAAHSAGALQVVHPALHWSSAKSDAYSAATLPPKQRIPYGFALLASGATDDEAAAIIRRLRLTRDESAAVAGIAAIRAVSDLLRRPDVKPSGAVTLLDRFPAPAISAYAHTTGNPIARAMMLRYLDDWRITRPILSGRDLIELGVPAGPQVQRGLQLVRAARLDGWAHDRDDERALVIRFAKRIRDSGTMSTTMEFEPGGD